MPLDPEYVKNKENYTNILAEFPIIVPIPLAILNDCTGWPNAAAKHAAIENWIIKELHYPEYQKRYRCNVMDYICFRFRTEEDAAYFKLRWG